VTLVNTKGMAFFGPGSEWFWAALQFTALAITFIAIYRQLRVARSARAVELVADLTREFDNERMMRHRLSILLAVRDGRKTPNGSGIAVGIFLEGLGALCRRKHLDVELLRGLFGQQLVTWWIVMYPFTIQARAEKGADIYSDFEWLVGVFNKMDRKERFALKAPDEAFVRDWVPGSIEGLQERILVEEALRSVPVAAPLAVDASQSSASEPAPTGSGR
jgi:hypothetical protein